MEEKMSSFNDERGRRERTKCRKMPGHQSSVARPDEVRTSARTLHENPFKIELAQGMKNVNVVTVNVQRESLTIPLFFFWKKQKSP